MSIETPAVVCATDFVATVRVVQDHQEAERQFTSEDLNPIAMRLLQRIWDFGGQVVAVKKLALDGSWEIGFYPNPNDRDSANYAVVGMSELGDCVSLLVRDKRYEFRTDEEFNQIIPNEREAFLARFRKAEERIAAGIPRSLLPSWPNDIVKGR